MIEFLQYLILAIIQGILEWLPVSSEGFLILTAVNVLHMDWEMALRVGIYFHLGTSLSVVLKYWKDYWAAITKDVKLLRFILLATLATGVFGIPLYLLLVELNDVVTDQVGLWITLGIGILLLITATLLRFGRLKQADQKTMDTRTIGDEILLGVCQGFAILPGISRSGTTSTFLILRGYTKEDAFRMSFFISLPAVLGAVAFDVFKELIINDNPGFFIFEWSFLIYLAVAAGIGYFTMDLLLKFAKKSSFDIICYVLGGITIILAVILLVVGIY